MQRGITNPLLLGLLADLNASKAPFWKDVARRLSRPARIKSEVNLSRINRYAKDGETVLVPGKLLSSGNLSKKVTVSAFSASEAAKKKLAAAGGKFVSIREMMKQNPKGSKVRVFQ